MEIYLVRHGETVANQKGLTMGQVDTPLTEKGKSQVRDVAKKLQDISFDVIYCSDLGRAIHSALIIKEVLSKEISIIPSFALRETDYGVYSYMDKNLVKNKCPEYLKDLSYVFPTGESVLTMHKRVEEFVKALVTTNKTVLIVGHGGTTRVLTTYFNNISKDEFQKKKLSHSIISRFSFENGNLKDYFLVSE